MRSPDGTMVEPDITINGAELTFAQSMTVRVAVSSFAIGLQDPEHVEALGPIGLAYQARIREIFHLIARSQSLGAKNAITIEIDTATFETQIAALVAKLAEVAPVDGEIERIAMEMVWHHGKFGIIGEAANGRWGADGLLRVAEHVLEQSEQLQALRSTVKHANESLQHAAAIEKQMADANAELSEQLEIACNQRDEARARLRIAASLVDGFLDRIACYPENWNAIAGGSLAHYPQTDEQAIAIVDEFSARLRGASDGISRAELVDLRAKYAALEAAHTEYAKTLDGALAAAQLRIMELESAVQQLAGESA